MKLRIVQTIYSTHSRFEPQRRNCLGLWTNSFNIKRGFNVTETYRTLEDAVASILYYDKTIVKIPIKVIYKIKGLT